MAKRSEAASNLKLRQDETLHNIGIALLQEPTAKGCNIIGLNPGKILTYVGKVDKDLRIRAGIWIRHDIYKQYECTMMGQFTNRDMVTMKCKIPTINGSSLEIVISSVYMPSCEKINNQQRLIDDPITDNIANLVDHCINNKLEIIIGCDSNAHHSAWGCQTNNRRGNNLMDFISSRNLHIINKGDTPTFIQRNRKSIIDLTITSPGLHNKILDWTVSKDMSFSDHRIIKFGMNVQNPVKEEVRSRRKTDWIKFNKIVKKETTDTTFNYETPEDLELTSKRYQEILINAYQSSCKLKEIKIKSTTIRIEEFFIF